MPQVNQSFSSWYPQIIEQAKRCNFDTYTPERAARESMVIQTENKKLREKALSEGPFYNDFVKASTVMKSSNLQEEKMEKAENINWI